MNAQKQVGQFLKQRGYQSEHAEAHVIKAYLKMVEEVAEIGELLPLDARLLEIIAECGRLCRIEFDALVATGDQYRPEITNGTAMVVGRELADVQVTVFDLANGVDRRCPIPGFDVVVAALEKSGRDIARGVRQQ